LINSRKSTIADYQAFTTVRGGLNPGTWMHEDVALKELANLLDTRSGLACVNLLSEAIFSVNLFTAFSLCFFLRSWPSSDILTMVVNK
jgi:hypothetical protein